MVSFCTLGGQGDTLSKSFAEKILACLELLLLSDQGAPVKPSAGSSQDATLYTAILRHYLHQDAMMWSRVQLLIAIQAGVLAGSVGLRGNSRLAAAVLLLGASFTLLIFWLVLKDELDRDVNLPLLDALARRLTDVEAFKGLNLDHDTPIRLAAKRRPWYVPLRGRAILRVSIIVLLVSDVGLALAYLTAPSITAQVLKP